ALGLAAEGRRVAVVSGGDERPLWAAVRADGRNSGAYPLDAVVAAAPLAVEPGRLAVYPNPGSGGFRFRLGDGGTGSEARAEIYDVRGRRVRALAGPLEALAWDGRHGDGRPAAAGTYFAVVRAGTGAWTTRFVLTR
ncbi:MAG TPA: T9SS type A sorting domain-containing protein, partial [Candidatus Krumholzibacteria bacterium]|nr:T9SS type A sorting domain-containing protein [Candidatus Krumholzibacteria bacterium]